MGDIPYDQMFSKGDHVVVQLVNGDIFEGNISDAGKNRLDLIDVQQHQNPNKLGGVYSFYRTEIEKILDLKVKQTEKPIQRKEVENKNRIKIVEEEYDRLKEMAKEYVYLNRADKRYYDAITVLSNAENIGVMALGLEPLRDTTVKLLAISTWKEVYLFDLIEHKNKYFYPELKDILESEYVCKIIHKGGPLADMLYRNYSMYIQNIFDTEVVDLIIQKSKTGQCPPKTRDISQCLTEYFHLPSSLIHNSEQSSAINWVDRPLKSKYKFHASQLVTYLVMLKCYMERILLSKTFKTIDNVHDLYYNSSLAERTKSCHKNIVSEELKDLIPSLSIEDDNCIKINLSSEIQNEK